MSEVNYIHESAPLRTLYGDCILHIFSFGTHEEDNILVIAPAGDATSVARRLVRVQSACYTSEIFRSTDCDCHEQLHESLEKVFSAQGLLVYMLSDGRGAGLLTKIRGLALGESDGLDTHDAYERLGVETDPRTYERAAAALRALGATRIALLTNNPRKIAGLRTEGLSVQRQPLLIAATPDSLPYLQTKQAKMGHLLDVLREENG